MNLPILIKTEITAKYFSNVGVVRQKGISACMVMSVLYKQEITILIRLWFQFNCITMKSMAKFLLSSLLEGHGFSKQSCDAVICLNTCAKELRKKKRRKQELKNYKNHYSNCVSRQSTCMEKRIIFCIQGITFLQQSSYVSDIQTHLRKSFILIRKRHCLKLTT